MKKAQIKHNWVESAGLGPPHTFSIAGPGVELAFDQPRHPRGYAVLTCPRCSAIFDVHVLSDEERKESAKDERRVARRVTLKILGIGLCSLALSFAAVGDAEMGSISYAWQMLSWVAVFCAVVAFGVIPFTRASNVRLTPRSSAPSNLHTVKLYP